MSSIFFYHPKIYLLLFSAYLKYTSEALFLDTNAIPLGFTYSYVKRLFLIVSNLTVIT